MIRECMNKRCVCEVLNVLFYKLMQFCISLYQFQNEIECRNHLIPVKHAL